MPANLITLAIFSVSCNELCEVGRRSHKDRGPQVGEPRLRSRVCKACIDLLVELFDYRGRRILWRPEAKPRASLEASAVVTAKGRSLPTLMYSIDSLKTSNMTCT